MRKCSVNTFKVRLSSVMDQWSESECCLLSKNMTKSCLTVGCTVPSTIAQALATSKIQITATESEVLYLFLNLNQTLHMCLVQKFLA